MDEQKMNKQHIRGTAVAILAIIVLAVITVLMLKQRNRLPTTSLKEQVTAVGTIVAQNQPVQPSAPKVTPPAKAVPAAPPEKNYLGW